MLRRIALSLCGLMAMAALFTFSADVQAHGLVPAYMDLSVSPCQDFYDYANGSWQKNAVISPEYGSNGVDRELDNRNELIMHQIVTQAADDKLASPSSAEGKVGSFYRSGMNTALIESQGAAPLNRLFTAVDAIHNEESLSAELGRLQRIQVQPGFYLGVGQDDKDSTSERVQLYQGGIQLPEPGYYQRTDADTKNVRAQYIAHVQRMFQLLGANKIASMKDASIVLAMEIRLANSSMTPVQQRDPQVVYHKLTEADLKTVAPAFDWKAFFAAAGVPKLGDMIVGQPHFFATFGAMTQQVPLADWKIYLKWNLITTEAPRLSSAFVQEDFHFNSTVLNGVPSERPRWKRILYSTDAELGDALGQLYVQAAFSPVAKQKARTLVRNLQAALKSRFIQLDWMSPATKLQAIKKLSLMAVKVGYPDHWRSYAKLDVTNSVYVINCIRADEFEFQRNLNKLGRPVDRTEWGMTASTNNAYYSDEMNDINFPAGILQVPYFDPQSDDAVNYGEIGATMGHEMTHGFDDSGRQFDGYGNLHGWWTAADLKNYTARAQAIATQYSAYEPLPGQYINGQLDLGENIADIGGLKIAYIALERDLAGKPRPLIDGFTPEQRFFIAYAQSWRTKERPEEIKVQLKSDPHSPAMFRVIGPISDMPEFRAAFHCPPSSSPMTTTIW